MFRSISIFLILIITFQISNCDKAPKIKQNPKDVVAIADFPFGGDNNVRGNIVFSARKGGICQVHVDMVGLPKEGGPFVYHIHENSVPEDRNCEACGLHFNPYVANDLCDQSKSDAYCQVGDLSGKHGSINTTCFELKYQDPYLSLNPKSKSYIVGKSVVFHFANLTKIACADIEIASDLRLQSLIEEYIQTDDKTQLQELRKPIELNYKFDETNALSSETYESDEEEVVDSPTKKQQVLLAPKSLLNKTKNMLDDSEFTKKYNLGRNWRKHNSKNYSNVTIHDVLSESENNVQPLATMSSLFISFIFGLLAVILI